MNSIQTARYLITKCDRGFSKFSTETNQYKFSKVLLLYKSSRFEIEQYRKPELTKTQLENDMRKRGIDIETIKKHHEINKKFQNRIQSCLMQYGIKIRAVNRFHYSQSNINWCDVVLPVGGDGTFLLAASQIHNNKKPVIGFNSDPCRSEGHLCLPKKYSTDIESAIYKILKGHFKWMFRTRIRVTFSGDTTNQRPLELHEPGRRFRLSDTALSERNSNSSDLLRPKMLYQPPYLALNEVFLGEVLTAKVSYFEMRINESNKSARVRSSGLCVCTGTGSTSWSMSMNGLNCQDVRDIVQLYNTEMRTSNLESASDEILSRVCDKYNQRFKFNPEEMKMAYTIRDLISVGVWPQPKGVIEPRGFADKIEVKSKCTDAGLVLDGGITFPFNEGTITHLETHSEDMLRTAILHE